VNDKMNLWQKIVEVRKSIGSLNKDKKGYNFSYVTGDQILNKIKYKMDELGLILQPSTEVGTYERHDYKNTKGASKIDFIVTGQGCYTWINAENPKERETVLFAYYGQQGDDVSQSYGTALTYAERYFLLKYFGIATDGDDPDHRRQTQKETEKPAPKKEVKPTPPKKLDKKVIDILIQQAIETGKYTEDTLRQRCTKSFSCKLEDITEKQYGMIQGAFK